MPSGDEARARNVYAHFGLAIFLAQCLEHGTVNALLYAGLMPKELKRDKRRRSRNSRVDLARRCRDDVPIPNHTDLAEPARTQRGFVASAYRHDFVARRASA